MNTKPLVTIAIPFYNCDQFLDMAICSVINQSYSNWELLLINDGSTDKSLEIALKYKDPRIQLISDGSNKGLIYRLNQSIVLAHGYFYARMDADDIMHPKRIERQVEYMINNPQIDVLGTSYYSINSNNNIMYQIDIGGYLNKKDIRFLHPSAMAKVNWFLTHQYSSLYLRMEDYELWLRSSSDSLIYTLPEALMYYREFGIPTWKKYILSQNGIIKLYSQYKKYDISIYNASKKILITFCKIIISTICYLTGRMDLLIKMRKVYKTKPSDMAYIYLYQAIKH